MSEEEISPGAGGRRSRGVRASDEDREQLIAELNEHTVAGRLDTDELERRVQAAYAARTTGQLDALRSDRRSGRGGRPRP
jgi:predicted GNAT superfamily acetyltransferase